jgi:hypothetical protein
VNVSGLIEPLVSIKFDDADVKEAGMFAKEKTANYK